MVLIFTIAIVLIFWIVMVVIAVFVNKNESRSRDHKTTIIENMKLRSRQIDDEENNPFLWLNKQETINLNCTLCDCTLNLLNEKKNQMNS